MATKIGINGFGRIGRQVFKAIWENFRDDLEVVAVNDLTDNDTLAYLLKYDSSYGITEADIEASGEELVVDGVSVDSYEQKDPAQLPWEELGVEIVLESTGVFRTEEGAAQHLSAGAKKVLISAPGKGGDIKTIVLGVNDEEYDPDKHDILSNASCTTNCLAPLCKVLDDAFEIQHGLMTTVHSYTSNQVLQDFPHKDLRRGRAAGINIIPTTTGAAAAIGLVIPKLDGKMHGMAMRVPTVTGSIVDLTVAVSRDVTEEEVNEAYKDASESGSLAPYLEYSDEPIVLQDIVGNPASAVFDSEWTTVRGGNMVKVLGWYDNEWAYSMRTAELLRKVAEMGT